MRQFLPFAAAVLLPLTACDDKPDTIFFQEPSRAQLVGVWVGTEEITTAGDLSWNSVYADYGGGFSFPVVVNFRDDGRFTLTTSNFSTSFARESDRTCSGVFTHTSGTVQLFADEQCRALPLNRFTIGRILDDGISLEAQHLSAGASIRVRIRLEKD